MHVILKKWGNSPAVRVSSAAMKELGLQVNDMVNVRVEDGRIIVEPLQAAKFSIKSLLANITPKNLHSEIEFGASAGKEIF